MRSLHSSLRINNQIRAPEVRVIGSDGKQEGILKLSDALEKARSRNKDLIEIAPNAKPPVVKIIELGKYKYELEKKLQREKKKAKASEVKEVRFSPFIANHDYLVRLEKIKDFLNLNNKVRIVVVFMGRQMGSKQFGYDLIRKITSELEDRIAIDMEPKFIGRHLITTISPFKKAKKEVNNAETENKKDLD